MIDWKAAELALNGHWIEPANQDICNSYIKTLNFMKLNWSIITMRFLLFLFYHFT